MSLKRKLGEMGSKRLVSYGVLLYKRVHAGGGRHHRQPDNDSSIQFLLGVIPQRNAWTVFKGMPSQKADGSDESPAETALREFEEETGSQGLLSLAGFSPVATLHGRAGKKHLEIYLHEGSFFDEQASFCAERVVKIDGKFMHGHPEIVAVRWLTLREALDGADGAKIYKSQENILQEAHAILISSSNDEMVGDGEGDVDEASDEGERGQKNACQSNEK